MIQTYFLAVDIGTGVLKAALFSANGKPLGSASREWSYTSLNHVPGGLHFEPQVLLASIRELVADALLQSGLGQPIIFAAICTCQRLGFVFLDQYNQAIYGIPNIDRRAESEAAELPPEQGETIYSIAGRWPSALHLFNRIKWFKKRHNNLWQRVAKILSISDWLAYMLSGEMISEPTTACETCLFDIQKRDWSGELLDQLEEKSTLFTTIGVPGMVQGRGVTEFAATLGLSTQTRVIVGGGDTEFGTLGVGALFPKDVAIIAGSSAPVELVVEHPVFDPEQRTILNPYFLNNLWLVESNAMLTGTSCKWVKDLLFPDSEENGYTLLNDCAEQALEKLSLTASYETPFAFLGPSIMNSRRGNLPPLGGIILNVPAIANGSIDRSTIALSALEAIAFSIKANIAQLARVGGSLSGRTLIGGGQTRNRLLLAILIQLMDSSLLVAENPDVTLLGGALLAMQAIGIYTSLESGMHSCIQHVQAEKEKYRKLGDHKMFLKETYQQWLNMFKLFRNVSFPK